MTRRLPSCLAVALLPCLLLSSAPVVAAEKVELKLKFREGDVRRMVIDMDIDIETKMKMEDAEAQEQMPGTMKGTMKQRFEAITRVAEVAEDGSVTLEFVYDRVKYAMDMGPVQLEFDSAKDQKDEDSNPMFAAMANAFKPLVGLKLTIKLGPKHQVKSVEGFDAFWEALAKDPMSRSMTQQMRKSFGNEQLSGMMDQWFTKWLPAKPVAVGDTWTIADSMEIPMLGAIRLHSKSKLVGVEEHLGQRCAKIEVQADMKTSKEKPTTLPQGMGRMNMKIHDSSMKGTTWFAIDAGEMLESTVHQDMRMAMTMSGGPKATTAPAGGGMRMEQHMKMKMRMTSKPETKAKAK